MLRKLVLVVVGIGLGAVIASLALAQGDLKPATYIGLATVRCWEGATEVSYEVKHYALPGTWAQEGARIPANAWSLSLASGDRIITSAPCSVRILPNQP